MFYVVERILDTPAAEQHPVYPDLMFDEES
jgi:hypothetical protein